MKTDRELINEFLDKRTFDEEDRAEVMRACEQDPEARMYWLWRSTEKND